MAFCGKCGTTVSEGPGFCPNCGAAIGQAAPPPPYSAQNYPPPPPPPPQYGAPQYGAPPVYGPPPVAGSGLQENIAALLSYVLGWLTGIIFLLVDKRPYVRFHAAQSIVVFGFLFILRLVLVFATIAGGFMGGFALFSIISLILSLVTLAAWIILMVMAYQGKQFEVPIAAGIARSIAGKV